MLMNTEGCTVWVEINGPRNEEMETISLNPKTIRDLTTFVIDNCPRRNGEGGFVTEDFANLVRFFTDPSNTIGTFQQPFRELSLVSFLLHSGLLTGLIYVTLPCPVDFTSNLVIH